MNKASLSMALLMVLSLGTIMPVTARARTNSTNGLWFAGITITCMGLIVKNASDFVTLYSIQRLFPERDFNRKNTFRFCTWRFLTPLPGIHYNEPLFDAGQLREQADLAKQLLRKDLLRRLLYASDGTVITSLAAVHDAVLKELEQLEGVMSWVKRYIDIGIYDEPYWASPYWTVTSMWRWHKARAHTLAPWLHVLYQRLVVIQELVAEMLEQELAQAQQQVIVLK